MRRAIGLGSLACLGLVLSTQACGDDETTTTGSPTTSSSMTTTGGGGEGGAPPEGIHIEGLDGPITAAYDDNGLLHLTCASDDDCYAALGYFHASNRFFFMDFVRNFVRGKLGKLVSAGETVLEKDFANRLFFSTAKGQPLEEKMVADSDPETKGHLDAYTRGVNAWIDDMHAGRNDATLTTEYDFSAIKKENIRAWEAEDSAAVGLYVLNDLSNESSGEIAIAANAPLFDPALAPDLFSPKPVFDAFTIPQAAQLGGSPTDAFDRFYGKAKLYAHARETLGNVGSGASTHYPGEIGSNNWLVGGSKTKSGKPILANDPHLSLTNPSIWFGVELDAKSKGNGTYHVAGSTFPGLPSVMVGHNETLAWGVTTTYYDLADVYEEKLTADNKSVLFNGKPVDIIVVEGEFEDASSEETPIVKHTMKWVPHHGPIISEDLVNHTAVSVRWRGHDGGSDIRAFFEIARAPDMAAAKKALGYVSSADQNFIVIDDKGNYGYFPYSKVPSRPWASAALPPWLPLPGDGTAEWGEPIPTSDLPQLENPADGFIATANQDITGASADGDILNDPSKAFQAVTKADGTREARILEMLLEGSPHSAESMHAMQGDTSSLYGTIFIPAILAANPTADAGPDEKALLEVLAAWNYTCPTGLDGTDPKASPDSKDANEVSESRGCAAAHAVIAATVQAALGDEVAAANVTLDDKWDLLLVARALKDPASVDSGELLWDNVGTDATETKADTLKTALTTAAAALKANGALADLRWGKVHTLTLRSIYDSFGIPTYNDGPYAAPGGLFTVNVANPSYALPKSDKPFNFEFKSGPSIRFVVEMTDKGPHMTYELPGGNDLHRESPFYNNLLPNWLVNKPIDFPFGPDAVPNPAKVVEILP